MKKPHVSSHTFGITLFLFVLVFAVLEYTNLSLVGANLSHNTDWYLGQDENAKKYNESIFLAERGDFTGAKSVLSPILNEKNLENPGDVFELYGDLVYQMGGASGDILPFYHRALEQGENLRIEKKITMLLSVSIEEEIGTGTSVDSSLQGGSGDTSSGSMSRETTRQELKELQENRKGAVNFSAPMPGDAQREIQGVWNILGGGEEKRDW